MLRNLLSARKVPVAERKNSILRTAAAALDVKNSRAAAEYFSRKTK
jgi:hypothetical protein